ncbi:MAG: HEAT repeat domain-containing protein [Candidatus Odinarchaeota archaeon]
MREKSLISTVISYFIPGFILNKVTSSGKGDPLEEFITNLDSEDYRIRKKTAEVLGHRGGDPRIIDPLIKTAIEDSNEEVRNEAVNSLKQLVVIDQPVSEKLRLFTNSYGERRTQEPFTTRVDALIEAIIPPSDR